MKNVSDLRFLIKVCGITREEDAAVAVEAGANAIGFNFYPKSSRFLEAERAAEIASRVEGEFLRVGVLVNASEEDLATVTAMVPLDVVQLHGTAARTTQRAWRAVVAGTEADVAPSFEAYLLDAETPRYGGSGQTFDWRLATGFPHRVILAGGLDATNVAEAVRVARPWGVDACSRLESEPGKKDRARVRDFVKAAIEAARQLEETGTAFPAQTQTEALCREVEL